MNYHIFKKDFILKYFNKQTISLIGMPCSGKTTIAYKLHTLGWNMIDTDTIIENKYNKKLIDVVNYFGDQFINVEKQTILDINNIPKKTVISTGGSVIYNKESMIHLSNISTIIHLDSNINDIVKRITNFNERGIIMKPNETLIDLYYQRKPLYQKYRDVSINNTQYNIDETASLINSL
jgi:shikimate kinase